MTSLSRRFISAVCAVTLATSLVSTPAFAETPSGGGLAEGEAAEAASKQESDTAEVNFPEPQSFELLEPIYIPENKVSDIYGSISAYSSSDIMTGEPAENWIDRIDLEGHSYARQFYDAYCALRR